MRRSIYIFLFVVVLSAAGCGKDNTPSPVGGGDAGVRLLIRMPTAYTPGSRTVNDDNLASEQAVYKLSVFLTEPSGSTIIYKYVNSGFSASGDILQVPLPLDASELLVKDIYVVTNYDNDEILEAIGTVQQLKATQTPSVNKNSNLDPGNGLCMYGTLSGFDFSSGTPLVTLERTCAKYRFTLTFPQGSDLSTANSVVIANAAAYTFLAENSGQSIDPGAYFNFASPMPLVSDGAGNYSAITYVYEASQAPVMYIYTNMNGEGQTFSAALPMPARNFLYDIEIEIHHNMSRSDPGVYTMNAKITETGHR